MRRQVKVGVYQIKIPKSVLRTYFASSRDERGLGINEKTALLSPWQRSFEVDRMQSRFASNVDMGPCQPARFWKKSFVYFLKAVALIGLRGHGREGKRRRRKRSLVAAALSKIDAGVALLVREVGVAHLLCFYSGRRDMYLLYLLHGCSHVVEIGRIPSIKISGVSTMMTTDSAVRISYLVLRSI